MKLSELKKMARSQEFDFARVLRVHSSLYRLSSGIPETTSPAYFNSMYSLLAFCVIPDHRQHIEYVGVTRQWSFGSLRTFDVISVWVKPKF